MTTRSLARGGLVVVLSAGAGAMTGAAIGLVTDITSRSDVSFGGMTLRGNGALIVPALLLPLAIAVGTVLVGRVLVGSTRWFAVPAWILALVFGLWFAGATLAAIRAAAETGRVNHTATLLSDGRVLVAGGGYDAATARATLYDPVRNEWIPVASMTRPRVMHSAVRLSDSRVLVVGGEFPGSLQTAEVFDPRSGRWTLIEGPRSLRSTVVAAALPDGRVVVAGATTPGGNVSAEIYDPRSGSWSTLATIPQLRQVLALEASASETIVAVGYGESQAVLIRTGDGSVTPLGAITGALVAAVPLSQGRMLVFTGPQHGEGGLVGAVINAASKVDVASASVRRYDITAVYIPDGFVLLAGGNQVSGSPPLGRPVSDAELLDLSTGQWSRVPPMHDARTGHTYTNLADGRVMVIGGANRSGPLATAEIFDPRTRSWTVAAALR